MLNILDWTPEKNVQWVNEGIRNGQKFLLASELTFDNIWDAGENRLTVFAQEVSQLLNAGYVQEGPYLVPGR